MKKIFTGILVLAIVSIMGAFVFVWYTFHHPGNISINIRESDERYSLYASYNRYKMNRVNRYLQQQLHNNLFMKSRVDAYLTLDDHTRVRIKSTPGRLMILLNKQENDFDSYFRIKQLGEGIKQRLAQD